MRDEFDANKATSDRGGIQMWLLENAETNDEDLRRLKNGLAAAIQNELTPRQQEVLQLFYFEQLSMSQIARDLGVNPSTISRTIRNARRRLFRSLRYSFPTLTETEFIPVNRRGARKK